MEATGHLDFWGRGGGRLADWEAIITYVNDGFMGTYSDILFMWEACFRSLQLLTKAPHPRCRGGICWVAGRPCRRHPHVRVSIVAMVEFLHLCVRWLIRFVVQVQEIQWARAEQGGVSAKGWSQSEQFLQRCAGAGNLDASYLLGMYIYVCMYTVQCSRLNQ